MRDGRVLFPPEDLEFSFAFNTVLSLPFLLDGVEPMLEAATDGDPATVPPIEEDRLRCRCGIR
jgi:iron complex transport system substrate-binding protein